MMLHTRGLGQATTTAIQPSTPATVSQAPIPSPTGFWSTPIGDNLFKIYELPCQIPGISSICMSSVFTVLLVPAAVWGLGLYFLLRKGGRG